MYRTVKVSTVAPMPQLLRGFDIGEENILDFVQADTTDQNVVNSKLEISI